MPSGGLEKTRFQSAKHQVAKQQRRQDARGEMSQTLILRSEEQWGTGIGIGVRLCDLGNVKLMREGQSNVMVSELEAVRACDAIHGDEHTSLLRAR